MGGRDPGATLASMLAAPFLAALALAAPPVQLRAADNGRIVRLAPGTPVVVSLASNPSTGFRWKLLAALDGRVVRLVSHRYVAPTSRLVGAPGTEVWRFRAVGRGRVTLRLGYLRSWQPTHLERSFRVQLRVS